MTLDEQAFSSHLLHGESVLWCGKPSARAEAARADRLVVMGILPLVILEFVGLFSRMTSWAIVGALAMTATFLSVALKAELIGRMFGRVLMAGHHPAGVMYAVTNQRILFLGTKPHLRVTAHSLGSQGGITFHADGNGQGTIFFGINGRFTNIDGVQSVFNTIQRALHPS